MRSQLLLVPAALIATATAPAQAYKWTSLQDGVAQMFPGQKLTSADFKMDIPQVAALMDATRSTIYTQTIKAWKTSSGGWVFFDQVVPRGHSRIWYVLGVNADGTIKGIEILECDPNYDGVQNPKWLSQYIGRRHNRTPSLQEIRNISGTTLSVIAITEGVQRVMTAYKMFFEPTAE